MSDCEGYFDEAGIPFLEGFDDAAVSAVYHDPNIHGIFHKFLIQCWFDTTYGQWNGNRFDLKDSRDRMAAYLRGTPYRTFEQAIAAAEKEKR